MVRGVLKNGVIHPLDPLPADWEDGREVWVEDAGSEDNSLEAADDWYQELEASMEEIDPEDMQRLEAALAEADRQAKEMMRREMGLG